MCGRGVEQGVNVGDGGTQRRRTRRVAGIDQHQQRGAVAAAGITRAECGGDRPVLPFRHHRLQFTAIQQPIFALQTERRALRAADGHVFGEGRGARRRTVDGERQQ